MAPRGSLPNADLPMFLCVVLLGSVFALSALGVQWLYRPTVIPNPGLTAYKPPAGTKLALPTSADVATAESSALLAAAENNELADSPKGPAKIEASVAGPNSKHGKRANSRKSRVVSRPGRENRGIMWGYASNPYSAYGRWF